jgi:hypothetical protein
MRTQQDIAAITREILGADYMELQLASYTLTEDLASGRASIRTALNGREISGEGVGLVDALFKGLQAALMPEYPSLAHIHFAAFAITTDFRDAKDGSRSDAPGTVRVTLENAAARRFEFQHTSPSISASSAAVVLQAVQHFVNAERAVLRVYGWIADARRRSRQDLADKYVARLADLVETASYSETIERARKSLG